MPAKTSQGNHGVRDQGSAGRGGQRAVVGSGGPGEVAEEQRQARGAGDDGEDVRGDREGSEAGQA